MARRKGGEILQTNQRPDVETVDMEQVVAEAGLWGRLYDTPHSLFRAGDIVEVMLGTEANPDWKRARVLGAVMPGGIHYTIYTQEQGVMKAIHALSLRKIKSV